MLKPLVLLSGLVGVTLVSLPSSAHVTVNPREATANSYAKLTFRVPHGCDGSPTTRLRVQFPEGFSSIRPMVHHSWQISIVKAELDEPYMDHGQQITERVSEIIWEAPEGAALPDEFMDEFSVSARTPDKPGETVAIPAVQECEDGVSRWIQVAEEGQDPHDLEEPAPLLQLVSR
ncbi:MAG: YcnI family protein [Synechococcaceae cyanobacterium SM2_3_2]|nr:YcnI family protein [Synechococcaceae cyanobacterium SM2_3_2]